jgi:hypothetical protein
MPRLRRGWRAPSIGGGGSIPAASNTPRRRWSASGTPTDSPRTRSRLWPRRWLEEQRHQRRADGTGTAGRPRFGAEIALHGGDVWAPAKPRPDEKLIRALARAHRWKRLLEEGKYRSAAEIADAEGVTRSFVNRMMRLTLLAPDIVEIILDGRQSKGLQLEELTLAMPSGWEDQRDRFAACWDDLQSLG